MFEHHNWEELGLLQGINNQETKDFLSSVYDKLYAQYDDIEDKLDGDKIIPIFAMAHRIVRELENSDGFKVDSYIDFYVDNMSDKKVKEYISIFEGIEGIDIGARYVARLADKYIENIKY